MLKPKYFLIPLMLTLLIPFSLSHAARNAPQILDGSIDEGARYFKVFCVDGKQTAIRAYFEEYQTFTVGDVCYKDSGDDKCSKSWSLDDAAAKACKAL
jgi:hypothetical protein